ncbi:hypothetical protein Tsubulata_015322 [Turnera subulata]|uniref:DUF4283 domain-containing protein n=1 Tax=Turnera subulata TaxID=218843 RepID=A0A9Q0FQD2_9ROSI|nr:hypothetical protein Tsubulata_015322 [Turnera subulata]
MAIETGSPIYDSNGDLCAKPAMALDLDQLDLLLRASAPLRTQAKGKSVTSFVLAPIDLLVPIASARNLGPIGPPVEKNLGARVSSNAQLFSVPVVSDGQTLAPKLPPTPIANTKSWASVATGNSKTFHQPLSFVPPIFAADSNVITIPPHLLELGRQKFSLCLVGQFMGKAPKLGFVNAIATKLWGKQGSVQVSHYHSGLFLFHFPNDAALHRALHGGPWHVGGVSLFLRQWSPNLKAVDFQSSLIPVWVQLNYVPLELLT